MHFGALAVLLFGSQDSQRRRFPAPSSIATASGSGSPWASGC